MDKIVVKIGAIYLVKTILEVSNMKEDLDAGSAMFINVETTRGLLQFAAYNEHNGYYGHEVKLVSKYDDKTVIEADDVLWQWNIYYN